MLGFPHAVSLIVRRRFHKNHVLFLIGRIIKDLKITRSRIQSIIGEPFFPEPIYQDRFLAP